MVTIAYKRNVYKSKVNFINILLYESHSMLLVTSQTGNDRIRGGGGLSEQFILGIYFQNMLLVNERFKNIFIEFSLRR